MNVKVYKIQVPVYASSEWGLKQLTHSNKSKAVKAVVRALRGKNILFTLRNSKNKPEFLNESGGVLATIVLQ